MIAKAQCARRHDAIGGKVGALHQVWQQKNATTGLSPNQSLNAQGLGPGPTPAARGNAAEFTQYNQLLNSGDAQSALRLSEGLRTNAYWDVNRWRTGYGSDTVTRADGTVEPVTATTQITPADAERDLQRRTALAAQTAQTTIGATPWGAMSPGAKAALTSVVYNYGHVPGDIAEAATSGDTNALARAIANHAGDNAGANFNRRNAEANTVLGRFGVSGVEGAAPAAPTSANGTPFSDQQLKDNPFLLSTWVRSLATDPENRLSAARQLGPTIEQRVLAGFSPPINDMAMYDQLSRGLPELAEQTTKIMAAVDAYKIENGDGTSTHAGLINLPPGQAQAAMDAARATANASPDLYHVALAENMKKLHDADVEALKNDPFGTAVAKGWGATPGPLDFNDANPLTLAVALHQRAALADAIGARTGDVPSPISPSELEQFRGAIATGPAAQMAHITAAIGTLPPEARESAVAALGPSIAGAAKSGDPAKMATAYAFIGEQYKNNPMVVEKQFGPEAVKEFLTYQRSLSFLPPDVALKRVEAWSDPEKAASRDEVDKAADKELSAVTPDQVAAKSRRSAISTRSPGSVRPPSFPRRGRRRPPATGFRHLSRRLQGSACAR